MGRGDGGLFRGRAAWRHTNQRLPLISISILPRVAGALNVLNTFLIKIFKTRLISEHDEGGKIFRSCTVVQQGTWDTDIVLKICPRHPECCANGRAP